MSFDFNSLYPNVMMTINISPDTKVGKIVSELTDKQISIKKNNGKIINISQESFQTILKDKCTLSANNVLYIKPNLKFGIIPQFLDKMYKERVSVKKESKKNLKLVKELEKEIKQIQKTDIKKAKILIQKKDELQVLANIQDLRQHAFKIFLNSAYGALGSSFYSCFDLDNAEAVTLSGQAVTKEMVKYTNKILNELIKSKDEEYVIAGDTDSCAWNAKVYIDKNKTMKIADIFNEYKLSGHVEKLKNGTEVAISNKKLPTKSLNGNTFIKNVSRHKVTKEKWTITVDNDPIEFTKDHSIMIFRNNEVIECKPCDILPTDCLLKYNENKIPNFELIPANSERVKIENTGMFEDEYVYDLEVEDKSHTFIVNNILAHNSIYVRMDAVIQHLFGQSNVDWNNKDLFEKIKNFVDNIFQQRLNNYCADFICKKFYTNQRRIEFKREKLSAQAEYTAKKRYIVHVYNNEGIDCNKWAYTGVDIKKNELPDSIKKLLEECVQGLIEFNWDNQKYQQKIKEIYDIFENMSIKDVAYIKNLNTPKESTGFLTLEKGAGAHARAAEYYNQIIKEMHLESKYEYIMPGDRFHYIYIKSNNKYGINVLGFKDRWPDEFNSLFEIDKTKMFNKTCLAPLEKIEENHSFSKFNPDNIPIGNKAGKSLFDL